LSEIADTNARLKPTPETGLGRPEVAASPASMPPMGTTGIGATTVWLTKPEAPRDAEELAVMRRAIEEDGAREDSLVNQCLGAARAGGLSDEDTYVFLAYQALLRLEETQQRHLYLPEMAPEAESQPQRSRVRTRLGRLVRFVRTSISRDS
jgi:hypothetical protein